MERHGCRGTQTHGAVSELERALNIALETWWSVSVQESKVLLRRHEEGLLLDLDSWLLANGLPLKTNLSAVLCQEGHLLIEAMVGA